MRDKSFDHAFGCGFALITLVWLVGLVGTGWLVYAIIDFLGRH